MYLLVGLFVADDAGHVCWQIDFLAGMPDKSEDCLLLHIWKPHGTYTNLPVMVLCHVFCMLINDHIRYATYPEIYNMFAQCNSHFDRQYNMNSQVVGTISLNCSELLLSNRPRFPEAGELPTFCKFQKLNFVR